MGPQHPPQTLALPQGLEVDIQTAHSRVSQPSLSEGHVEMDPIKMAGVCDWLTPNNLTEVQSFIGFVTSTSISSKMSHMWPSPYTSSLRKGKHGDGPRMNR